MLMAFKKGYSVCWVGERIVFMVDGEIKTFYTALSSYRMVLTFNFWIGKYFCIHYLIRNQLKIWLDEI